MLSVFEKVWSMSVTASVVILFVLIARLLLKKSPKIISYVLWGVVLVRLLCPLSFQSAVSLIPKPVVEAEAPELFLDVSVQSQQEPNTVLPAPSDYVPPEGGDFEFFEENQVSVPVTNVIRPAQTVIAGPRENVRFPVEWIWFSGAVLIALTSLVRYVLLRRKLRCCLPLKENVYLADDIPSAFVVGLVRTRIYLPSTLPEREWDYILAHERCHIRRGDPLIRLLSFAALCLHWFNPLVWLAFYLAGQDMEMSCDEAVIRKLGDSIRGDYSQLLLNLSAGRGHFTFTPLAFGEGNTGKRIRNLGKWKKPVIWIIVIAAILCVVLAICLLTDPKQSDGAETTPTEPGSSLDVEVPLPSTNVVIPEGEFSYPFYGVPAVQWNYTDSVEIEQFPGVKFLYNGAVSAENMQTGEIEELYSGMPVQNVFFADLTGDGLPELCSAVYFGSGVIDSHIVVYDYANAREYTLWERMENDYYLRLVDGVLWAEKRDYFNPDEVLCAGPLTLVTQGDTMVPVILDKSDWHYEMAPTTSSMVGGYDGYLFIEINDRIYRFRWETMNPQGLTADAFLGTYYENTIYSFDSRTSYQVYSTKEYADHTVLLVNVDGQYWASYRYAPAQRISERTREMICNTQGVVVLEDGGVTSGQEYFLSFVEKTRTGEACSIQTAAYYTLDPGTCVEELYQTIGEDYPRLYLHTLIFDGEKFTISWSEDGKRITKKYKYLMRYTDGPSRADAGYSSCIRYVLTNDNTVTWDDIFSGMISSQMGAYIDHYTVYTDYVP